MAEEERTQEEQARKLTPQLFFGKLKSNVALKLNAGEVGQPTSIFQPRVAYFGYQSTCFQGIF